MSRQFKLIKEYPGSPGLNTSVTFKKGRYYEDNKSHRKELVENNPDFWEKVEEKYYEILSFNDVKVKDIDDDGAFVHNRFDNKWCPSKDSLQYLIETYGIKSVKRLSDNVVFTIGDSIKTGEIKKFYLPSGIQKEVTLWVTMSDEDTYLSEATHKPKPLFTTEDGVDIFEGNSYVKLNSHTSWDIVTGFISEGAHGSYTGLKFSTKEKAEEYVLMNKPCLSINDVLGKTKYPGNWCVTLKELVESKI